MRLRRMLGAALAVAAVTIVLAGPGQAEGTQIFGSVGPGFDIRLTDVSGALITHLDAGSYELVVDDKSVGHNFRLSGPGVSLATEVEETGQKTFQVTVTDGKYTYVCDPHAGDMNGSFTGGSFVEPAPTPTPAPKVAAPKAAAPVSAKVGARLDLTVGPGFTIGLKTRAGKPVTNLAAGAYTIVVRDRAATHNAHLRGPGIDRTTGIPYVGTTTFTVTLKKGTLRFVCDPHRTTMKGAVAVN